MFYSHEILSNSQYGVATIWLIATVGKAKKVSRKAIQEVNVPKACEKIIDPGAPLALRLQGNLLYGVSRVFAQQCGYVLSDAEKTQSDMMTFFRVMQTSETDPQAGKAKRHQITLQDDPNFDPLSILPNLDLFNNTADLVFLSSQASTQRVSQMTPLKSLTQGSISFDHSAPLFGIELPPPSSHSANSYRLPSDFGLDSPFPKLRTQLEAAGDFQPFDLEDELDPIVDIGLNFDADGNIIESVQPEPELPPLPGAIVPEMHGALPVESDIDMRVDEQIRRMDLLGDDNVIILGEDALQDAEPFPRTSKEKGRYDQVPTSESTQSEKATAAAKKRRPRRKVCSMIDEQDHISRREFRCWTDNYLENMDAARKRPRATTQTQARKNAIVLLFGNGVANVGNARAFNGIAHPLAQDFAGDSLRARLEGKLIDEERRGRRRNSSEAFEDEEEEQRRVRQKVHEESEVARGGDPGDLVLGEELAPEMGMDAVQVMEDAHSSMMPWSLPGSAIPGSSIRGSARKMPAPSPLLGRGSVVKAIERHSDQPGLVHSDDLAQLYSQGSSVAFGGPVGPLDFTRGEETQDSSGGLDIASQEFLGYATFQAQQKGIMRSRDSRNRRWIYFENLADPAVHTKGVAAQAFLHILSLATKNVVAVEQDGIENQEPFGTIRIGLTMPQDDDADELA